MKFYVNFIKIITIFYGMIIGAMPLRFEEGAVISDSQVENFLNTVCAPAFDILGDSLRSRVSFHLVNSQTINAFATKNGNIFINVGVFLTADTPEEIIGVLFHELGHVSCDHLTKAMDLMKSLEIRSTILRVLAGVAAGMTALTSKEGLGVLPGFLGGSSLIDLTALTDMMHFSRAQEGSADQFALGVLKTLQWSMNGLATFMEKMVRASGISQVPLYLRTHPCSGDRLASIRDAEKKSGPVKPLDPSIYREFFKIKSKLWACTELQNVSTLQEFRQKLTGIPEEYRALGESIFLHRKGKLQHALKALDRFEKTNQRDAFTLELRSQILFENGHLTQALDFIRSALKMRPKDINIRTYSAIIALDGSDPMQWKRSATLLEGAVFGTQQDPYMWYWLGIALGKLNRIGEMHVAMAECAMGKGDIQDAKKHTHLALMHLQGKKSSKTPSRILSTYSQKYILRARDLQQALKTITLPARD
ncbi:MULTISPECIES: M48 family metalloprotease [Holospora]|uniref:TPR repeat-containing protein YfgC n=2 Tax=Holospora TaxID=44747 RepID=A0A061JI44_9PROT|nr:MULTISPECIES: M48 family metalloprotease [Holospora]ETZ04664.1 TPR repeat-containing protein YfgC [Holospora undulata HU1]GAJ45850.1 TPR repeat-containing protein YfgC [Holospora elegans E1]